MMKYQLDVKRFLCPIPVIKTQNKIKELQHGDLLEVICTDPGVIHDIPAWCRINGHKVLQIDNHQEITIIIECNKSSSF